jgi:hypothetical protein
MPKHVKSYRPPWKGDLLLACRNCQKKLKGEPGLRALAKVKKTIKRLNKEPPNAVLHVINVPCMDLCPLNGVTVCNPSHIPHRLSILRSKQDINALLCEPRSEFGSLGDVR